VKACRQIIWKKDLEENLNVCPKCGKHFRIDARGALAQLFDDSEYETFSDNLASTDPLKFVDLKPYSERLKRAQSETGLTDAVINARGKLNGRPVIISAMEYGFIGGSMGSVVGEMITRAIEEALQRKAATHYYFRFWRSANDGRSAQPDAVGKNCCGPRQTGRSTRALRFSLDRSHYRRRDRVFRNVGRFEHC